MIEPGKKHTQPGRMQSRFWDRKSLIVLLLGFLMGMAAMVFIGLGLNLAGWVTFGAGPCPAAGPALTCPSTPDLLLVCPICPTPPPTATATATETPTATPDFAATATAACATFETQFRPTPCP